MTPSPKAKGKYIFSVQRAIRILELYNDHCQHLGITEMATRLGLPKSTVAGLVYTLESEGYLHQDQATRKYRLGFKLIERGAVALDSVETRQLAFPHLAELRDWCDETVFLFVMDDDNMVLVARLLGSKVLGVHAALGTRVPYRNTAMGRAVLSYMVPEEVRARTGLRSTLDINDFLHGLQQVRERGFVLDDEEHEVGVRYVAAPVFDHTGHPMAAVSVSVPSARLPIEEVFQLGEKVRETARAVSRELGFRGTILSMEWK